MTFASLGLIEPLLRTLESLDYTTPTFYDTLTAGMQELLGGQSDPQQFVDALQTDYAAFLKNQK